MLKVGIVGGSGYTGGELIRYLCRHPQVKLEAITSRTLAGKPLAEVFPSLRLPDLPLEFSDLAAAEKCDLVFLAVPHGVSSGIAADFIAKGLQVIDLGADFRLNDLETYERWYQVEHKAPDLFRESVYGLPELHREEIKKARIIGNPGCYPTSAILALAPLLSAGLANLSTIVINSLSGVSGAGRSEGARYHFPHCNENLYAYGVASHRHLPEIEQELSLLAGEELKVSFTPHLVPTIRGILSTITVELKETSTTEKLLAHYRAYYQDEYFVRVLTDDLPQTHNVYGSNFCELGLRYDRRTGRVVLVSAIDNLGKGAASQAIQNMNLMQGWEEKLGIDQPAIYP